MREWTYFNSHNNCQVINSEGFVWTWNYNVNFAFSYVKSLFPFTTQFIFDFLFFLKELPLFSLWFINFFFASYIFWLFYFILQFYICYERFWSLIRVILVVFCVKVNYSLNNNFKDWSVFLFFTISSC